MSRQLAAAVSWLFLALQAQKALASVTGTSTEYVVVTTTSSVDYYDSTQTITTTRTVKSYIHPTAKPTATSTYVNTLYDVEVVELYIPAGSVHEYDLVQDFGFHLGGGGGTSTIWIAPVTLSAPASCPTPFTIHTTATVSVAATQTADLHPTSTASYTGIYGPVVQLYLSAAPPGPAPTDGYDYTHYVANCRTPPTYSSSSGSGGLSDDDVVCTRRFWCMTWRNWIIVLATVLPGLFLLGFVESFFWFRQLMRGRRALRLGTVCWTLLSAWMLCFTRTSPARHADDWPALEAQWNDMPPILKWRLWWKWGFRHQYPVDLLGPDPKNGGVFMPEKKVEEGGVQARAPEPHPQYRRPLRKPPRVYVTRA